MILSSNFWINLRDYFVDKFTNIHFGDIVLFLIGIIAGFLLFALFYLIMVLSSFRRKEPAIYKNVNVVEDEKVRNIIDQTCLSYKEENYSKPTGEKLIALKDVSIDLIGKIAHEYYPDSPHPVSELSVDELVLLTQYITKRVDELLSARVIKPFRKYRISKVLKIIDTKKRIEESKVVTAAKRANLPKIAKVGWAVLHAVNPVFWIKKLIINPSFSVAVNKMADIIIHIVGDETSKVYSKSVFNNEAELDSLLEELDKGYEE